MLLISGGSEFQSLGAEVENRNNVLEKGSFGGSLEDRLLNQLEKFSVEAGEEGVAEVQARNDKVVDQNRDGCGP